jgi:hypothetical protein
VHYAGAFSYEYDTHNSRDSPLGFFHHAEPARERHSYSANSCTIPKHAQISGLIAHRKCTNNVQIKKALPYTGATVRCFTANPLIPGWLTLAHWLQ